MAFKFNQAGEDKTKKTVDFEALNQHVIDQADAEQPEVVQGVIAGIVDLGEQIMPDSVYELKGDRELGKTLEELNEEFKEELETGVITKFDISFNGNTKQQELMKFVPQKNRHCVDILVDFPDIVVDKGQFYDNSNPKPLRLSLGGQFYQKGKGKMLIQRPMPLKLVKDDNAGWTMPLTSTLYKMALAGKVIEKNQPFVPQDIDKLLGVNLQFTIQIYNKLRDGRKFYTEYIKLAGGLGKKMEAVKDYPTFMIQFSEENDPELLKDLRKVQINQMEESPDFEDSILKKQLESLRDNTSETEDNLKKENDSKLNDVDQDLPF